MSKIKWITFLRNDGKPLRREVVKTKDHQIVLTMKGEIPALGYGPNEIRKMLKKFNKL